MHATLRHLDGKCLCRLGQVVYSVSSETPSHHDGAGGNRSVSDPLGRGLSYSGVHENQALSALLFLYKEVLRQEVGAVDAVRARKPKRLPTVLTKPEALQVLNAMVGVPQVMAKLLYGSGVRGIE
jgi:hypothetical protein